MLGNRTPRKTALLQESEQAVDERREGGAFGQNENQPERQEEDDDGREPPLLADTEEAPEFAQD